MTTRKSLQCQLILGSIILFGCLTLLHTPAYPQAYIAGQLGVSKSSLSSVDVTTAGTGSLTFSSPIIKDLKDSFLYGAKLGYYSQSVRWFGVETEVFRTTPHIEQTVVTVTGPGGTAQTFTAGSHLSVTTWAPLNLLFRYPAKRLQPYAGIGPGLFFANRSTLGTDESQSNIKIGLNAQLGLRYFMSRHLAVFGEYKFNYVRFNFNESATALDGFKATYSANIFVFGVGYHF